MGALSPRGTESEGFLFIFFEILKRLEKFARNSDETLTKFFEKFRKLLKAVHLWRPLKSERPKL